MTAVRPGRGARAGALALVLAVLASPSTEAWAEPDVLVLPYQALNKGVSPELAEQTTAVIAQEIGAMGIEVARADDVAEAASPSKSPAKEARSAPAGDPAAADSAADLIEQAKAKMEDDPQPAIEMLEKAAKLLAENGDAIPDLRLLSEAHLQLGVAYFRNGDEDKADEALTQAAHFAPTRELEETEFPPIFIRVYQRVRYNVLRRPRANIEVRAAPGAQVLLDGRNLGKAPIVLAEALPGTHWVRVERPGEAADVKKIVVRSKRTILVEFEGAQAAAKDDDAVGVLGAVARGELDKAALDQLKAAGKRAGAKFVMVGAIYRTDTAYNIYTSLIATADGAAGRLAEIAFDLDMLSAQIEVFKLAEDAKKQIKAKKLADPVSDGTLVLAPKLDLKSNKRRAVAAGKETKLATVIAAPPPIEAPKEPQIAEVRPALAGAGAGAAAAGVVRPASTVIPKDEGSSLASNGHNAALVAPTTAVVPIDERDDGESAGGWWIWVVAGAAVVGAGVGGYFLFSGGSPDDGTLRIRW